MPAASATRTSDCARRLTADAVSALAEWRTIEHDADLVVVTPAAVLVVRSFWCGPPARPDRDAVRDAARDVARLVRAEGYAYVPVVPVVLTWGPRRRRFPTAPRLGSRRRVQDGRGVPDGVRVLDGVRAVDGVSVVDGVYVLDGDHAGSWSRLFATACMFRSDRARLGDLLERAPTQPRLPHRAGRLPRPIRSHLDGGARLVGVARS